MTILLSENWADTEVADKDVSASKIRNFRRILGDSVSRQAWHSKAARHICDINDPYVPTGWTLRTACWRGISLDGGTGERSENDRPRKRGWTGRRCLGGSNLLALFQGRPNAGRHRAATEDHTKARQSNPRRSARKRLGPDNDCRRDRTLLRTRSASGGKV